MAEHKCEGAMALRLPHFLQSFSPQPNSNCAEPRDDDGDSDYYVACTLDLDMPMRRCRPLKWKKNFDF
jgi:hypothetical protein